MSRSKQLFPLISLSLACISCANSPGNSAQSSTTDATTSKNERIVALTSLSADIIAQIDPSKLVGITDSKLLKDNTDLVDVVRVSKGRTQPNLEQIVALKPDLIIGADGFHDQILAKAQELGISTLKSDINDWKSLESFYQDISQRLNQDASAITEKLKSCQFSEVDKANDKSSGLVLVSHQPILAPNQNSWAGDLLTKFQVDNPVASMQGNAPIEGYVTLSEETVLTSDPDFIFVVNSSPETLETLRAKSFWSKLKAVKNDKIYTTEYYGMVNPGSIQSIQAACQQLSSL